jgi:AbrB family looped-hinge helix DNA binding protein
MAKVTSKLRVTIPKHLAEQLGIRPGDDLEWSASAGALRLTPRHGANPDMIQARLRLFDQAMKRQRRRNKRNVRKQPSDRGWKREDLYASGRSR